MKKKNVNGIIQINYSTYFIIHKDLLETIYYIYYIKLKIMYKKLLNLKYFSPKQY